MLPCYSPPYYSHPPLYQTLPSPTSPPLHRQQIGYQHVPVRQQLQNDFVVGSPLAVHQTKNTPLTLTAKYDRDFSVKKVGKSLSCYTKSMEMVWHGEFNRLCQHFLPHHWYLSPTFTLPQGNKWLTFKDSAKVRFLCSNCAHGWTSMKGRVVFWFTLDETQCTGIVFFRLFGQRCQLCKLETFEHAMWYPEEVLKVVGNTFNRIGQEYYGFYRPPVRIDRRSGKPLAKHNADMCQACSEGLCPAPNFDVEQDGGQLSISPSMAKLSI